MLTRSIAPALLVVTIGSGIADAQDKAPAPANPLHYARVPEPGKPGDPGWDKLSAHEQNVIIDRLNASIDAENAAQEAAAAKAMAEGNGFTKRLIGVHYLRALEPQRPGDPGWDRLSFHEQNLIIDRLNASIDAENAAQEAAAAKAKAEGKGFTKRLIGVHYLRALEPQRPGDPGWEKLSFHEQNVIIDSLNASIDAENAAQDAAAAKAMAEGKGFTKRFIGMHYLRALEPRRPGDPGWDKLSAHEQNQIIDRLNAAMDELPLPQAHAPAKAPSPVAQAKATTRVETGDGESAPPETAAHGFIEKLDADGKK
jgi:hypothetical protein